jgi:hypothetical protein
MRIVWMLLVVVFGCVVLAVATGAPSQQPVVQDAQALVGRWFGLAVEQSRVSGERKEYTVLVRVDQMVPGKQAGGTAYQSLQCAATLHYLSIAGEWFYFFEKRTAQGSCPSGHVRMRLTEDGTLAWQWYHRSVNHPVAVAALQRMSEAP